MTDVLAALGLVLVAELGDKSMLLALALATRYRPLPVIGGITIAAFLMLGVAAALGSLVGSALPGAALAIGGGILFVVFGILALRSDDEDEEHASLRSGSVLLGVTLAFLVAEFGDKTMLATATLASTRPAVATWIGGAIGMAAASITAVLLAVRLGRHLPARTLRLTAAGLFLVFGALLLVEGLSG